MKRDQNLAKAVGLRGAMLEGDVRRGMYDEAGFLNVFADGWDGSPAPERAYAPLDAYLRRIRR